MQRVVLAVLLLVTMVSVGWAGHTMSVGTQTILQPGQTGTAQRTCSGTYYKSNYVVGTGDAWVDALTAEAEANIDILSECQIYRQPDGSLKCNRPSSTAVPVGFKATAKNTNARISGTVAVGIKCKTYSDHRR